MSIQASLKSFSFLFIPLAIASCVQSSNAEKVIRTSVQTTPTMITKTTTPMANPTQPESGQGNADVTYVRAVESSDGTWTFHVTVEHLDVGWEDYADGWNVVTPNGVILKPVPNSQFTRTLLHPHVEEQPFTRSQSGIEIPPGVNEVTVRAHDLVDGFGGIEVIVDLTKESEPGFEVRRP